MSAFHQDNRVEPAPTDAPGLISDAIRQASRLFRSEVELAKREMKSKATRAAGGLFLMVLAAFLVLSALDVLTAAAVAAIAEAGLPVSVASLLVGGTAVALAAILFVVGRKRVMPDTLAPEKTIKNVRKDIETIKETANV